MKYTIAGLLLFAFTAIGSSSFAAPDDQNIEGFFVNISSAGNKGDATFGNNSNPNLGHLKCAGMFEAEDVYSIRCSSGSVSDDQNAEYFLFISNIFAHNALGTLVITTQEGRMDARLFCNAKDVKNPGAGADCK
jgi:hypothetical protein